MKTFTEGQSIEFKRDADFGRKWEKGYYIGKGWSGWHQVRTIESCERFLVPSRRIRDIKKPKS